jgi:HEAT repeat protein
MPTSKFNVTITDHEEIMFQEIPPAYWRSERSARRNRVFKEANLNRIEWVEDRFSGASGGTIYNGDALPKEFYGNVFTTDVSGSLIHRDVLSQSDTNPVMLAKRTDSEKNREFIYSTDTWFRPVTFSVGPDGYLYILDYYRQHIETPVSIPDDLKAEMDFMAGSDMGRIYRLLPENVSYQGVKVELKKATGLQLVDYLSHKNGWYRSTAQRLLLERQDKTVVPAVKSLFSNSPDPRTRLHALYVLEGLNALNEEIVKQSLLDSESGVRENGIMLAERYSKMVKLLIPMVNDPSKRVSFQAALSLGQFEGKNVIAALAEVITQYGQNDWFRSAVLSSEAGSSVEILNSLIKDKTFFIKGESWKLSFIQDLSNIIGARYNKEQFSAYLKTLSTDLLSAANVQQAALKGLKAGLNKSESTKELAAKLNTSSVEEVKQGFLTLRTE